MPSQQLSRGEISRYSRWPEKMEHDLKARKKFSTLSLDNELVQQMTVETVAQRQAELCFSQQTLDLAPDAH